LPISKNGTPIATLEDWEQFAGPMRDDQWVDGRSAKETARAWLEGDGVDLPKEVATLLKRHDAFGRLLSWSAEPEGPLRFDDLAGEPRPFDLLVQATDEQGDYLIAVDGTVDEPFGDTVGDTLAAAVDGERPDGVARVTQLVTALLGARQEGDPALKDIRYQLVAACAGALGEAGRRGHPRVLVLVHEFVTDRAQDRKLLVNAIDLGRFVKRLSHGAATSLDAGELHGPFAVPGAPLLAAPIDLFIGKVSRNMRSRRG